MEKVHVTELISNLKMILEDQSLSKEDLLNPQSLRQIYIKLLSDFNISLRHFPSLELDKYASPNYLDTFLLNLLWVLRLIFDRIPGASDFSLTDLSSQTLKRTTGFLWHLTNFYIHSNGILGRGDSIRDKFEKEAEEHNLIEREIQDLADDIKTEREKSGKQKILEESVLNEINKLEMTLQEVSKDTNEYGKQNQMIIQKIKDENSKHQELTSSLKEFEDEVEKQYASRKLKKEKETEIQAKSEKKSRKALLDKMWHLENKKSIFIHNLSQFKALRDMKRELNETLRLTKQSQWSHKEEVGNAEDLLMQIEKPHLKGEELANETKIAFAKWTKKKKLKMSELEEYINKIDSRERQKNDDDVLFKVLNEKYHKLLEEKSSLNTQSRNFNDYVNHQYSDIIEDTKTFSEFLEQTGADKIVP